MTSTTALGLSIPQDSFLDPARLIAYTSLPGCLSQVIKLDIHHPTKKESNERPGVYTGP